MISARRASQFFLLAACLSASAFAQRLQVVLDPALTKIEIYVHDVHGGVHGTFRLKSSTIRFERSTGDASGVIVVDATSGQTGNSTRDNKMHRDVLESARYPEITFTPKRVVGEVAAQGKSNIQVQGVFRIHGGDHDLTLSLPVEVTGEQVMATTSFNVPYQAWGMKNPSMLFLRVDGTAEVKVSAAGRMTLANGASSH